MSLECSNTCRPSLLRHVWLHKKVLYSRYYDILVSNVILSRFPKKLVYFNVHCHSVDMMKIQKYDRTFVLKKHVHNVPRGSLACS
jgi:hypothetical protein